MPSVSKKQHNLMAAVANNPKFAKKVGIKQSVGEEFISADKGKQFKSGGSMATKMNAGFMAMMKKKTSDKPMKKEGMAKTKKMAMGGYAEGGMPMVMKDGKKVPSFAADGKGKMAKGGMAKAKKMASGGSASSRADGIAVKGKTKGKMMAYGGKC